MVRGRDVDRVIEYIREQENISPIHRQVMVNRLDFPLTDAEIERARDQVMGREPVSTT